MRMMLNGNATVINSHENFTLEEKKSILNTSEGKELRFTANLVDPNELSDEVKALVLAEIEVKKAAKAAESDLKKRAQMSTGEVRLSGRARVGGLDKDGNPIADAKQSLTCRVNCQFNASYELVESKAAPAKSNVRDELAALLG